MNKLICNKRNNCEFGLYCICAKPFVADPMLECKLNSGVTFSIVDDNQQEATDDITAIQWILKQPGLMMVVGKNKTVSLTYGHCFEITATSITDAVTELQNAQQTKDNTPVTTCIL